MAKKDWVVCQYCGVKLKQKNLEDHLRKVHPEQIEHPEKSDKTKDLERKENEDEYNQTIKYLTKFATVLDNHGYKEGSSDRKFASHIIAELYECPTHRLSDEERFDFEFELRELVLGLILGELRDNLPGEDGLDDIEDILNVNEIAIYIAENVKEYFEDDQLSKSHDILSKIMEWGEKKGVIKREENDDKKASLSDTENQ